MAWAVSAAMAAPLPPDEPPGVWSGFHGLRVAPKSGLSESAFQPSSGVLTEAVFPASARVETWIEQGASIPPYYDPMIAKIICHAATREEAIAKMSATLDDIAIEGPRANLQFLARTMAHPEFVAGRVFTGFVERYKAELTG